MKKLITVLAILVVLVGAVFAANSEDAAAAAGTSKIQVSAKIKEAVPVFQLATNDSTDLTADKTATKETAEKPTASVVETVARDTLAAGSDLTISFKLNQVAKANLKANYTIEVSADPLLLTTNSDGTPFSGTQSDVQKFLCDTPAPAISAHADYKASDAENAAVVLDLGVDTSASNKLTLEYTGKGQLNATTTAPVELGTFDVKWKGNANAVAGTYTADVTMLVSYL
jgi:hypothetical protein